VGKRNSISWLTVSLTLILLAALSSAQEPSAQAVSSNASHIGVNYLTLYHLYDTPAATLQRDFARFKKDGINTIVIVMYWYRLESSKGVYNQQFINNVIRVANIAASYGLSVMIDFHTLIGDSDAWSNPTYVGVGMNLISNPAIASAYVAMVTWAVNQLKGVPNVWCYSLLNEPWYWPLDAWRKNSWISLTVSLSNAVRRITSKPVTVRFVAALFERDWGWNSTLLNALSFISLNAYVSPDASSSIYWQTFADYKAKLGSVSQKAAAVGKQVQITEFGSSTANDALQSSDYQAYTNIFKSTPNLTGWLAWGWDVGYDPNNPSWSAIGTYSLIIQATGVVRPAYTVLVKNR